MFYISTIFETSLFVFKTRAKEERTWMKKCRCCSVDKGGGEGAEFSRGWGLNLSFQKIGKTGHQNAYHRFIKIIGYNIPLEKQSVGAGQADEASRLGSCLVAYQEGLVS